MLFTLLSRSLVPLSSFRFPCLHRDDNQHEREEVELTIDEQILESLPKSSEEDVPKSSEEEDDVEIGTHPALQRALDLPTTEV